MGATRSWLAALLLALLLVPQIALAGKRSMIPPGQEQRIRELVDAAIAAAEDADELPVAVTERVAIGIDRDRIRVELEPVEPSPPLPRLVVFHPDAIPADSGLALAPGVALECGPQLHPTPCPSGIAAAWTGVAKRLASAREPHVDAIWQIEETGVQSHEADTEPQERGAAAVAIDRVGVIAAVLVGLWLLVATQRRRPADAPERIAKLELAALLGLLALFVIATASATSMLPLHEHNSFVARSDCAIDPRCVEDPAGAWSMTTIHGYGLLLERIPYRASALARLSLALSVIVLALVWGLTRRLMIALGRPRWAGFAGLCAVAVLASNPVVWRLSGAATFWPWTLCWVLAAALAGLTATEPRATRTEAAGGWILAAVCMAFAATGNLVGLTLAPCLVLAPIAWTRAPGTEPKQRLRGIGIGLAACAAFALLTTPDYLRGYARAFGSSGLDGSLTPWRMLTEFEPLLLDPSLTTPIWVIAAISSLVLAVLVRHRGTASSTSSRLRALRVLAPVIYAYAIPAAVLGVAAGIVVGSGYPVGFINHHWELAFTAIAVGLALAWGVEALERLRPSLARLRVAIPIALTVAALALAPRAREGWRLATGERVLERELVALERSFAELPEHDLLVVAPQTFEPLTDAPSQWDPLEVVFPVGFYEYAMRQRGLEPALVVSLDRMPPPRPGERVLLYVGSGMRSFQPHEIAAGVVPEQLERPLLPRVRDAWELEPVHEFVIATAQHEAISQRLGADRVAEIELGFYWMRTRE